MFAATAKNLIRTGANHARVAVTLWNTGGVDAYQLNDKDIGGEITIERRITAGGTAAYRVFDSKGRKISERRTDMQVPA